MGRSYLPTGERRISEPSISFCSLLLAHSLEPLIYTKFLLLQDFREFNDKTLMDDQNIGDLHSLKLTFSLKMVVSNRNLLFQRSIFRGELLVSGRFSDSLNNKVRFGCWGYWFGLVTPRQLKPIGEILVVGAL